MAQKNFIYISSAASTGGTEGNNLAVLPRVRFANGNAFYKMAGSGTTNSVNLPAPEIVKLGIATGNTKYAPNENYAVSQRTVSPLSGCSATLVPNYGQGATVVTTTWPSDGEKANTSSHFLVGGQPHSKTVNYNTGSGLYNPIQ